MTSLRRPTGASLQSVPSPWIKSSSVDLIFFSLGWSVILLAFLLIDGTAKQVEGRRLIIGFVLLVTAFHRHLTFPLVYGDPEQFRQRKRSYILLPLFFAAVTLAGIGYIKSPVLVTRKLPEPIQLSSRDALQFRTMDGKESVRKTVRFSGMEKTPEEVAATLNRSLGGVIHVSPEAGSLRLTLENKSRNSSFRVERAFGASDLEKKLGFEKFPTQAVAASQPILFFLVVASALWNFFHTLMQKQGILRIYSRKAGYGKSWLDKAMIWVWFAYIFFQFGSSHTLLNRISGLASSGRYLSDVFSPVSPYFSVLAMLSLVAALAVTGLYLKEEFVNRSRFHWPKNLFLGSVMALYGLLFYDFLIGYVAFGFSHAVEYLAFVNIFSRKKFLPRPAASSAMAWLVRRQTLAMGLFIAATAVIFIPWHFLSAQTLGWYILGSSFLHFLYDGWIWKVRDPAVGKPLGIEYVQPPKLQTA